MSVLRTWQGTARKTSKVQTITVGSNTNGHIFTIKLEHPSGSPGDAVTIISYTAGAAESTTTIASAISYLLRTGSTSGSSGTGTGTATGYQHEYALDVTWSTNASAVITATANTPGRPFLITTAGTGTLTVATTTANSGPNDWSVAGNWLEGVVPIDDDDIVITDHPRGSSDILYGLLQTGITCDTIQVVRYSGKVGSPTAPLKIEPTDEVLIDSSRCEFHMRGTDVGPLGLLTVNACNYCTLGQVPAVGYVITNIFINGGKVEMGTSRSDMPPVTNLHINGGSFKCYYQSQITNVKQTGGEAYFYDPAAPSGSSVLTIDGGTCEFDYAAGFVTITQSGGLVIHNAATTTTTHTLNAGILDATRNRRASKVITTLAQGQAGIVRMDTATMTVTTWTRSGPMETFGIGNSRTA